MEKFWIEIIRPFFSGIPLWVRISVILSIPISGVTGVGAFAYDIVLNDGRVIRSLVLPFSGTLAEIGSDNKKHQKYGNDPREVGESLSAIPSAKSKSEDAPSNTYEKIKIRGVITFHNGFSDFNEASSFLEAYIHLIDYQGNTVASTSVNHLGAWELYVNGSAKQTGLHIAADVRHESWGVLRKYFVDLIGGSADQYYEVRVYNRKHKIASYLREFKASLEHIYSLHECLGTLPDRAPREYSECWYNKLPQTDFLKNEVSEIKLIFRKISEIIAQEDVSTDSRAAEQRRVYLRTVLLGAATLETRLGRPCDSIGYLEKLLDLLDVPNGRASRISILQQEKSWSDVVYHCAEKAETISRQQQMCSKHKERVFPILKALRPNYNGMPVDRKNRYKAMLQNQFDCYYLLSPGKSLDQMRAYYNDSGDAREFGEYLFYAEPVIAANTYKPSAYLHPSTKKLEKLMNSFGR